RDQPVAPAVRRARDPRRVVAARGRAAGGAEVGHDRHHVRRRRRRGAVRRRGGAVARRGRGRAPAVRRPARPPGAPARVLVAPDRRRTVGAAPHGGAADSDAPDGGAPDGPGSDDGMRTRTPRKRAVPVGAAAAVAVTLLAGCAVNAGTAKARQFEADWEGTPDVSDVSASGANNLPFSGTADGTAVVAAGTPDERVAELLHALGGDVREHGGVDATLEVGHVRLGARPDREANDAVLDLWHGLRVEPGLVSAELGVRGVDVDLDDPTRFADLVEDLATPGGDLEPLADAAVDVRAGSSAAGGGAGDDPADALAAFRAVDERFGVTGAHLETTPPRVELRVADSADIADARALARRAASRARARGRGRGRRGR